MSADSDAFDRMVRAHHAAVLGYALRRASPDDARDVVAETFLVAWRRFADAPASAELPWLLAIARRVLANQRRAAGRRQALLDRLRSTPPGVVATDRGVVEALAQLAEKDRELLLLVAWEGLTLDEAAAVLGCRPGTARMRAHRARRRLATLLDPSPSRPAAAPSTEGPK